MGLGSIFGKPKKPKASRAEKANAEIAHKQWKYYNSAGFTTLEKEMLEESSRDFTELQQGRSNADVFQSASDGGTSAVQADLAAGGSGNRLAELNTSIAEAGASADLGASTSSQQNKNSRGSAAAGFGAGLAGQAISGNSQLNAIHTNEAISKMQRKSNEQMARFSAIAQLGGTALAGQQGAQQTKDFTNRLALMTNPTYQTTKSFVSQSRSQGRGGY